MPWWQSITALLTAPLTLAFSLPALKVTQMVYKPSLVSSFGSLCGCLTSFLCPLREHAPYGHRLGQEHPHHSRWNTTEWLSLSQQNWEHSRQAAGWLSPSLQVGWPPGWPWTEDKGRPASGQCKVNHSCILTKVFSVLMYVSALYVVRRWRVMVRMERVRW